MLQTLQNLIYNKTILISVVVIIIFAIVAYYTYDYYIKNTINPSYVPNNEYSDESASLEDTADLYYFYADWCPHCKKAKPIINKLKEYLISKNNEINNIQVNVIEVDGTKEKELSDKYKVEGYPTIKLVHGNTIIEYDANPDLDILKEFLHTSLH